MPTVSAILETAIYSTDIQRSAAFYRKLFGFPTLLESDRLIALDVAGKNVLLIFKAGATNEPVPTPGGTIPAHSAGGTTHFAFAIAAADVKPWQQKLETSGIAIESIVKSPQGAESIYFRDP